MHFYGFYCILLFFLFVYFLKVSLFTSTSPNANQATEIPENSLNCGFRLKYNHSDELSTMPDMINKMSSIIPFLNFSLYHIHNFWWKSRNFEFFSTCFSINVTSQGSFSLQLIIPMPTTSCFGIFVGIHLRHKFFILICLY